MNWNTSKESSLQKKVEQLELRLVHQENLLSQSQAKVQQLQGQVTTAQSERNASIATKEEIERRTESERRELKMARERTAMLEAQLSQLQTHSQQPATGTISQQQQQEPQPCQTPMNTTFKSSSSSHSISRRGGGIQMSSEEYERLRSERDELEKCLIAVKKEVSREKQSVESLERKLESQRLSHERTLEGLREALEQAKLARANAEADAEKAKDSLKNISRSANETSNDSERVIIALKKEVESLQDKLSTLQHHKSQQQVQGGQSTAQSKIEIETLKNQLQDLGQSSNEQISKLTSELEQVNAQKTVLESQLANYACQMSAKQKSDDNCENGELRNAIVLAENEIAKLRESVLASETKLKHQGMAVDNLLLVKAKLEHEISELRESENKQQQQLSSSVVAESLENETTSKLREQLLQAENNCASLEEQLKSKQTMISENDKYVSELVKLLEEEKNKRVQAEESVVSERQQTAIDVSARMTKENEQVKAELEETMKKLQELAERSAVLENVAEETKRQLEETQSRVHVVEDAKNSVCSALKESEMKCEELSRVALRLSQQLSDTASLAEREKEKCKNVTDSASEETQRLKNKLAEVSSQLQIAEDGRFEQSQRAEVLESEVQKLREQVQLISQSVKETERINESRMSKAIEHAKETESALENAKQSAEQNAINITELEKKLQQTRETIQKFEELCNAQSQTIAVTKNQLKASEEACNQAESSAEEFRLKLTETESKLNEMKNEADRARNAVSNLSEKVSAMENGNRSTAEEADLLLTKAHEQISKLEEEISRLKEVNERQQEASIATITKLTEALQIKGNELEQAMKLVQTTQDHVTEAENENERTKHELETKLKQVNIIVEEEKQKQNEAQTKLEAINANNDSLRSEIATMTEQLTVMQSKLEGAYTRIEEAEFAHSNAVENAKKSSSEKEAEFADLAEKFSAVSSELETVRKEYTNLTQEHLSLKKSTEERISTITTSSTEKDAEIDRLKKELHENADLHANEKEANEHALENANQDRTALLHRVEIAESALEEAKTTISNMETHVRNIESAKNEAEDTINSTTNELEITKNKLAQSENDIIKANLHIEQLELTLGTVRAEKEASNNAAETELEHVVSEANKKREQLEEQLKQAGNEIDQLRQQSQTARTKIEETEFANTTNLEELEATKEEMTKLQGQLLEVEEKATAANKEAADLRDRLTRAEEELTISRKAVIAANEEISRTLEGNANEMKKSQERIDELTNEIEHVRNETSSQKVTLNERNTALIAELKTLEQKQRETESIVETTKQLLEKSEAEHDAACKEAEKANAELNQMHLEITKIESEAATLKETVEANIKEISEKDTQLLAALERARIAEDTISELKSINATISAEIEALRGSMEELKSESMKTNENLHSEIEILTSVKSKAEELAAKEHNEKSQALQDLSTETHLRVEAENVAKLAREEASKAQNMIETLTAHMKEMETTCSNAEQKCKQTEQEASGRIATCESEIEALREQCEKETERANVALTQVAELLQQIADCKELIKSATNDSNSQIVKLQGQLESEHSRADEAETALANASLSVEQKANEVSHLTQKLEQVTAECDAVKAKILCLESSASNSQLEVEELKALLSTEANKAAKLQIELETALNNLSSQEKASKALESQLRSDVENAKAETESLRSELANNASEIEHNGLIIAKLEEQSKKIQATLVSVEGERDRAIGAMKDAEISTNEARKQADDFKAESEKSNERANVADEKLSAVMSARDAFEAEAKTARTEKMEQVAKCSALIEELVRSQNTCEALTKALRERDQEIEAMKQKLTLVEKQLGDGAAASTGIIDGLRTKIADLAKQFDDRDATKNKTESALHSELLSKETALAELRAKIATLEQEVKAARTSNGNNSTVDNKACELLARLEAETARADKLQAIITEGGSSAIAEMGKELDHERQQHALTRKQLLSERKTAEACRLAVEKLEGKQSATSNGANYNNSLERELLKATEGQKNALALAKQREDEISKMRALLKAAQERERDMQEARDKATRLGATCRELAEENERLRNSGSEGATNQEAEELRQLLDQKDEELNSMAEGYNKLMVKNKKLEQKIAAIESANASNPLEAKENQIQPTKQSQEQEQSTEKKRSSIERPVSIAPLSPHTKRQHV